MMKNKYYKTLICVLAITFAGNTIAQKYDKKYAENFNVNKDVEIQINASNTEIIVSNWNKNEVQVEATIEIEGLTKEEAEKYFKNWKFEALGNKSNIKITAHTNSRFPISNEAIFLDKSHFRIGFPEIMDIDTLFMNKLVMPKMDFDFNFGDHFSTFDEYSIDKMIGKNGNYSFHWKNDDTDIKIESKDDWEKFKKSKDYEKWKENLAKNREKMRKKLELSKEKMRKQMVEAKLQFEKIDREKMKQQLEKARHEMEKVQLHFSSDNDDFTINGKKVKITKKIEIKAPKGTTFDLNTRHCKVKLPNTVAFGNVKYGSFDANNLNNSKLTINYSPVNINDLSKSNVYLNNVTDAKIASVTNTKLNTNSSKVTIQNIYNNVDLISKFGEITIYKIHPDFKKFSLNLNAATAILNNMDMNNKFLFEINATDNYKSNPAIKLNVSNQKSKEIKGNFTIKTKDSTFFVNGKYSQITLNQ